MEYAFFNGVRIRPKKGIVGNCTGCGNLMIAKCGEINIHHWAHAAKIDCDTWWENETPWHRNWKDQFPERYREIVCFDANSTEHHRADIVTKTGVTIEFQNSPLNLVDVGKREKFYPKLIWVLNGLKFKGFTISFAIPDPNHGALKNFEITQDHVPKYFPSDQRFWPKRMKDIYSLHNPHLNKIKMSPWHDSFVWKNIHKVWLNATSPVLVDLGGYFLYLIKKRKQLTGDFFYLKKIPKNQFISRYAET